MPEECGQKIKLHLGQVFSGGADGWQGSGLEGVWSTFVKPLAIRLDSQSGYIGGGTIQKYVSTSQIPLTALMS